MLTSWCQSFSSSPIQRTTASFRAQLQLSSSSSSSSIESESLPMTEKDLQESKADLIKCCKESPKPDLEKVASLVVEVESIGEQLGIGQSSSSSGLLSGEWELLYSPEDVTRSSPFFWAFRRAFPSQSDQIFDITDSIPAPIKEVGPAYQEIDLNTSTNTGHLVSRVKVATLGGMANSVMTTRATIVGVEGLDGIRLKIETTKPEQSTIVKKVFGPLGDVVNENLPPFPSGAALERVKTGSSEVVMRTTYCDEGLRISRNDDNPAGVYVWKRKNFATFEML